MSSGRTVHRWCCVKSIHLFIQHNFVVVLQFCEFILVYLSYSCIAMASKGDSGVSGGVKHKY